MGLIIRPSAAHLYGLGLSILVHRKPISPNEGMRGPQKTARRCDTGNKLDIGFSHCLRPFNISWILCRAIQDILKEAAPTHLHQGVYGACALRYIRMEIYTCSGDLSSSHRLPLSCHPAQRYSTGFIHESVLSYAACLTSPLFFLAGRPFSAPYA